MDQSSDHRLAGLSAWVNWQLYACNIYQGPPLPLAAVSGDASFRRYFRCQLPETVALGSVIAVDAPPQHEDNAAFVAVDRALAGAGVPVPQILADDLEHGFLLLSDLGDTLLKQVLTPATAEPYLTVALQEIQAIMQADFSASPLPDYSRELLRREMELFPHWFCERFLGLTLAAPERQLLTAVFEVLEQWALQQQQVPVHRDFHTRNLMPLANGRLGVIDFQDAVRGPVTYDLVSLLRDETFPTWDQRDVRRWVERFAADLRLRGLGELDDQQFWLDFNAMGAQRHLKVAGIFARLHDRDGKTGYLEHTPQSIQYLLMELQACGGDGPACLRQFADWLIRVVVPPLVERFPASAVLFQRERPELAW
ncbi:MAG: phosphotransferase [Pseudomonadota bacterium]|nr:phosphotransferase [Pseudomonadota bacterium]